MKEIKELSKIMSPVRLLSMQDWEKVAKICEPTKSDYTKYSIFGIIFMMLSRFESLTRGKWVEGIVTSASENETVTTKRVFQPALLTKEMFVCGVNEPDGNKYKSPEHGGLGLPYSEYVIALDNFRAAQKKLWFKGAKTFARGILVGDQLLITFYNGFVRLTFSVEYTIDIKLCTTYDFIYHLSKYNETATTPIHLEWSEDFINELLKA